jgi:hypothetical protein
MGKYGKHADENLNIQLMKVDARYERQKRAIWRWFGFQMVLVGTAGLSGALAIFSLVAGTWMGDLAVKKAGWMMMGVCVTALLALVMIQAWETHHD